MECPSQRAEDMRLLLELEQQFQKHRLETMGGVGRVWGQVSRLSQWGQCKAEELARGSACVHVCVGASDFGD